MKNLIWLVPFFPLAGFILLAGFGTRMPRRFASLFGVGTVAFSCLTAFYLSLSFMLDPPATASLSQDMWTWFEVGGFAPKISFYLDPLSIIFILIITFVGLLIHLYSVEFMRDEEGYSRFFAYLNLFVASMLILVLAGDLLLLYLGWEGVGLCSYLLIGFWYKEPKNGMAARKAFIVTRIGDTAMALGLFLLIVNFNTLEIQQLLRLAPVQWESGSGVAVAAAALLLGGALGKSAQLPLQTWLPDAMAGPTPVSALIHAATMVTAGVYLITRTFALFNLAPSVMEAITVIGAITLLVAGFSALAQSDIKRVLAYSTISQIGYMFLALGVGAWSAALFHFVTHAFFKALLFLAAGAVIMALDHEHDMMKMGGLRRKLPLVFFPFLAGAASLSALPLITAGFYSKDLILWDVYTGSNGNVWLWGAGLVGAFITSLYTFRMVFLVFFGSAKTEVSQQPGWKISLPLVVLACFSLGIGFLETPAWLGHVSLLSEFSETVLPVLRIPELFNDFETSAQIATSAVSILGVFTAWVLFYKWPVFAGHLATWRIGVGIRRFLHSGCGFDFLYNALLVQPFLLTTKLTRNDPIDLVNRGFARISLSLNSLLTITQSGIMRWYLLAMVAGSIIIIGMVGYL